VAGDTSKFGAEKSAQGLTPHRTKQKEHTLSVCQFQLLSVCQVQLLCLSITVLLSITVNYSVCQVQLLSAHTCERSQLSNVYVPSVPRMSGGMYLAIVRGKHSWQKPQWCTLIYDAALVNRVAVQSLLHISDIRRALLQATHNCTI